jgi:hypothetical protein
LVVDAGITIGVTMISQGPKLMARIATAIRSRGYFAQEPPNTFRYGIS